MHPTDGSYPHYYERGAVASSINSEANINNIEKFLAIHLNTAAFSMLYICLVKPV